MTKDEKINKLLEVYCNHISIPRGEAYAVAFGTLDGSSSLHDFWTENLNANQSELVILTDRMAHLELVTTNDASGVRYSATPYGREIQENGGWLKHLELKSKRDNADQTKENLEDENLKLQNDSLRNELTTRESKEEIDKLTIKNLKLQNRNNRIWFTLIGSVLTFLISNWKEILTFFGLSKSSK
jgi:hypothetical protein